MFCLTKWSKKEIIPMFCLENLILTTKFEKFKIDSLVQSLFKKSCLKTCLKVEAWDGKLVERNFLDLNTFL
jgi:hypothetical protein